MNCRDEPHKIEEPQQARQTSVSKPLVSQWPPLRTPRLTLREFEPADEKGMFELESNEENVRYQDYGPKTREQARQDVLNAMQESQHKRRQTIELAVVHEGHFVGRLGAHITSPTATGVPRIQLWYSFLVQSQGRGLATEALRAFIGALRERGGQCECEIECDPRNVGSWRMAERLGFEKYSLVERAYESKGEWVDSLVYRKMF